MRTVRNAFLFLFPCLFLLTGCTNGRRPSLIPIGERVTFYSEILQEERELFIYLPEKDLSKGAVKYPVLFVLDGESMFHPVTGVVEFLSKVKGNDFIPEMIVVGIPNTHRDRDLTPRPLEGVPASGGGADFARFFREELFPFVGSNYPASSHRTILGHSYGGLWAVFALAEHPEMFDQYIALDPSLQYLSGQYSSFSEKAYQGKALYIGIADTPKQNAIAFPAGPPKGDRHYQSLLNFSHRLDSCAGCPLDFYWEFFEGSDHASLCMEATHDALKRLFHWYHLDFTPFFHPREEGIGDSLLQVFDRHFSGVSARMRHPVRPKEDLLNKIAGGNLSRQPDFARVFLDRCLERYPKSFNAHFLMGQYYFSRQQFPEARKYYEQALKIRESEEVRQALEAIQGKD